MNTPLGAMLEAYGTTTLLGRKNAMKEVMQEVVLCCADFFCHITQKLSA